MFRVLGLLSATAVALAVGGAIGSLADAVPPAISVFTPHDWVGVWRNGQNVILISANPDETLSVVGAAYPVGGSGRDGRLDFEAAPVGGAQSIVYGGDSDCAAILANMRATLVVRDNGNCAVTFDGVYRHQ
jgi:hypothetical protein